MNSTALPSPSGAPASVWTRIKVPLLLSAIVLVARLVAELLELGSPWASTAAGGGFAVLGITWLIPVFGFWFGWNRTGERDAPDRPGLALAFFVLALVLVAGTLLLAGEFGSAAWPGILNAVGIGGLLSLIVSWRAWPGLFRTLFGYGLAVRILVVLLTLLAFRMEWSTHFQAVHSDYDALEPDQKLCLASGIQLVFWVPFTVGLGGVAACMASMVRGRRPDDAQD